MTKKIEFHPLNYQKPTEQEVIDRSRNFLELMKKRRTVREFSRAPVPDEVIFNCIEAAGTAPSGAHLQPWHFVVVKDPEIKRKIRLSAEHEERNNYESRFSTETTQEIAELETRFKKPYLEHAPVLIVVFKESYRLKNHVRRNNYYVNESVGIATGLLITALHYSGLVALPHTPGPAKSLNELLKRPSNEVPTVLFPVGYPADNTRVPGLHRKSMEEILSVV